MCWAPGHGGSIHAGQQLRQVVFQRLELPHLLLNLKELLPEEGPEGGDIVFRFFQRLSHRGQGEPQCLECPDPIKSSNVTLRVLSMTGCKPQR